MAGGIVALYNGLIGTLIQKAKAWGLKTAMRPEQGLRDSEGDKTRYL